MVTPSWGRIARKIGAELPIYGFSHDWEVTAEVSAAGGCGVLGTNRYDPEQLRQDLAKIRDRIGDAPFGINLLMPLPQSDDAKEIPASYQQFLQEACTSLSLTTDGVWDKDRTFGGDVMTREHALELWDVCYEARPSLVSFGLGAPPAYVLEQLEEIGAVHVALVGSVRHVQRLEPGTFECVVAQGLEAAGHTGSVTTSVLVPEVLEAVEPNVSVVAAGGISRGSQIAAAQALGADGVWIGSALLVTDESTIPDLLKTRLLEAGSHETYRTRGLSGKPSRQLKNRLLDIWESKDSPEPLESPLQGRLMAPAVVAGLKSERPEIMVSPAGQGIGLLRERETVAQLMARLSTEYDEAIARMR